VAPYSEADLYAPGGALADKREGPELLATATDSSLSAMFPKGVATQAQVMQALGVPGATSSTSDGTSVQVFTHSYTAYQARYVQIESLAVEYDHKGTVSKLTLTKSSNRW